MRIQGEFDRFINIHEDLHVNRLHIVIVMAENPSEILDPIGATYMPGPRQVMALHSISPLSEQ